MSVGKLLDAQDLFALARQRGCHLLIPSGAIAGIDARQIRQPRARIREINLTTRKPLSKTLTSPRYLFRKGINLAAIKERNGRF